MIEIRGKFDLEIVHIVRVYVLWLEPADREVKYHYSMFNIKTISDICFVSQQMRVLMTNTGLIITVYQQQLNVLFLVTLYFFFWLSKKLKHQYCRSG